MVDQIRRHWEIALAAFVLVGTTGCGETERSGTAATTSGSGGSRSGGTGGNGAAGDGSNSTGSSSTGSDVGGGGGTGGDVGSTRQGSDAGAAGAAGAGASDSVDFDCANFGSDNEPTACEPLLRAVVSTDDLRPTQFFEYDSLGRLVAVSEQPGGAGGYSHLYSYDSDGRVHQYHEDCDASGSPEKCDTSYEFFYRAGGSLERMDRMDRFAETVWSITYNERGDPLEWHVSDEHKELLRYYEYRDDGQLNRVTEEELGTGESRVSVQNEYSSEGLLLETLHFYDDGEVSLSRHYDYEDGKLVEMREYQDYFSQIVYFDDLGQPGFSSYVLDADERGFYGYVQGRAAFSFVGDIVSMARKQRVDPPDTMFPAGPYEFGLDDVSDFSFDNGGRSYDKVHSFDSQGRVQAIEFDYFGSAPPLVIEIHHCEGAVVELTRYPNASQRSDTTAYYYGCDDFVLPESRD